MVPGPPRQKAPSGARPRESRMRQGLVVRVGNAMASAAGAVAGFQFGQQIGGIWLSLLLAINAGVFCALVADMLLELLARSFANIRR